MIPDAGGARQTFVDMAAKLADSGYAVLLPDVYYRQGDWAPFDMQTAFTDDERAQAPDVDSSAASAPTTGHRMRTRTSTT